MPRTGVLIISCGQSRQAAQLAVAAREEGVADVLVVESGAEPAAVAEAHQVWGPAGWLHLPVGVPRAEAANAGERALPQEVDTLIVLAAGTTLAPGTITGLAQELADNPSAGLVGPALTRPDGSVWSHGGVNTGRGKSPHHLRPDRDLVGPPDWLDAAALALRRADFRRLGGFVEAYGEHYHEVDLGWRVRRVLGLAVVCRTDLHAVRGEEGHPDIRTDVRNRLWLLRANRSPLAWSMLVAETLGRLTVGSVVSRQGAGRRFRERGSGLVEGLGPARRR